MNFTNSYQRRRKKQLRPVILADGERSGYFLCEALPYSLIIGAS